MIPILHERNAFKLNNNGIGFLTDTIKAIVTEERNGKYELTLQYPITGQLYDQLDIGTLISVKTSDTSTPQAFRVFKISRPINGIVTYNAQHISYDLSGFPLTGFAAENLTPAEAITKALNEAPLEQYFAASSDIQTTNSTEIVGPLTVRGLLGGRRGSILDVWGGEYEFDNRSVILHAARGTDNGVTIIYGKNMSSLRQECNISNTYTHLLPYASYTVEGAEDEPIYVYLPEKVISLGVGGSPLIGVNRALIMDFTDQFGADVTPTVNALRLKAASYISATGAAYANMRVNIKVEFVPLWQTKEYENIAPLEHVGLCDTVRIRYQQLGVDVKTKVIKTVYNSLTEKYESLTLGDVKDSFAAMYQVQQTTMTQLQNSIERPVLTAVEP